MYAIERTRIIKNYLEEHGQVQVQTLSDLLSVSEVTVRRDLERLEIEGWLTRTHGGAILRQEERTDPLLGILQKQEDEAPLLSIANVALRMISDGDVVMLSNGSVNLRLAQLLEERKQLTVLTNDVAIALRISVQENNRVVLLGGEMDKNENAVFGSMALANLKKYFVHRLFIEIDGVNDKLQLTVSSQDKADLILGAIEVANETIALCTADKFSRNAFFRLGDIHLVHKLVSNTELAEEYKSRIFGANIPLFTSVAAFEGSG